MTDEDRVSAGNSESIMAKLKEATQADHARLEALPFFKALAEHRLPVECYVEQLRSLFLIHGVMESEIAAAPDDRVGSVWADDLRKLPLLEKDLNFFAPRIVSDSGTYMDAAVAMTAEIRRQRVENPVALLGYLYVFEGSTLGNRMHQPDISATFRLDSMSGCRYYSSYQDQVQSHWRRFSERMNSALSDPSCHDAVIESARQAFSGLEKLYKALYPLESRGKSHLAARINPEAGNHPIPDDEREVQAALQASSRAWAAFPYYEARYGERGRRFSDSDTCWLVTLTRLDQDSMQGQIDWIGRVLATRGMPRLMLECGLRCLHEELSRTVPDHEEMYKKLLKSAGLIAKEREAVIPAETRQSLSEEFDAAVGSEWAARYPGTGKLIAAAVVDEKCGIQGAVAALLDWLTDGDRFPGSWVEAVYKILEKARQIAGRPDAV